MLDTTAGAVLTSGTFTILANDANSAPTATPHNQTVAPGTAVPLSTLFTYSDPNGIGDIVGFSVRDASAGGGHLFLNGVQQTDNVVFGNSTFGIPIGQISLAARKPRRHFGGQFLFRLAHAPIRHRFVHIGVGLDLRAIQGDVAEHHQPGCATKLQHLHEQIAQTGANC